MHAHVYQGQRVELITPGSKISRLLVGLGWDPVQTKEDKADVDCDVSVFMLTAARKLRNKEDIIYFRHLESACAGVKHLGDHRTGLGDGDNEQIVLDLKLIPSAIQTLVFVVTIYEGEQRGQDFSLIRNAFLRIANLVNREELVRFHLTEEYAGQKALLVGEIFRTQGGWDFLARGEGLEDSSLFQVAKRFT